MFRKPKKKLNKAGIRRKNSNDEDGDNSKGTSTQQSNDDNETTSELISQARKRTKLTAATTATSTTKTTSIDGGSDGTIMHRYETGKSGSTAYGDNMATRSAEYHPVEQQEQQQQQSSAHKGDSSTSGRDADGIFREKSQNKLLAGPIRAVTNIRTTCRFDYQPDICKDYKETGFCGFGDTCIYLHDRGDTLSGWQLEQQWEKQQKLQKQQQEKDIAGFLDMHNNNNNDKKKTRQEDDDGIPFACYLCRKHFTNPVVTSTCQHYFCESCIMNHIRQQQQQAGSKNTNACPICGKDTYGTFHQPTKLLSKKRRVLGMEAAKKPDSWEKFFHHFVK